MLSVNHYLKITQVYIHTHIIKKKLFIDIYKTDVYINLNNSVM